MPSSSQNFQVSGKGTRPRQGDRKGGALLFSAAFFFFPVRAPSFSKHCGCDLVAWFLAIRPGPQR